MNFASDYEEKLILSSPEDSLISSPAKEYEREEKKKQFKRINRHFTYFSVVASLNHALTYVVTSYASSVLDDDLASIILGLTWFLNAVSGLFVATFLTRRLGYKLAMIISLLSYTIFIIGLYVSIKYPSISWYVAIPCSSLCGVISAVWWTAQGVCFEQTCVILTDCDSMSDDKSSFDYQITLNKKRADLGARWSIIYQCSDIVVFMVLSVLPLGFGIDFNDVLLGLVCLGVVTTLLGFGLDPLGHKSSTFTRAEVIESIIAVPKQFRDDVRATLIAPFVFGFGISTAMFAYYINGEIVNSSSELGLLYIGLLESFSYLIAALTAIPFAYISNSTIMGGHYVMQLGSFCFMMTGVLVVLLPTSMLETLKWVLVIRTFYGIGRGVFEGSCRATYAQLFTGENLSTAFSSQTLLAGFSGGLCFFLYDDFTGFAIGMITSVNGAIALASYTLMISRKDFLHPIKWSNVCDIHGFATRLMSTDRPPSKLNSMSDHGGNTPLLAEE